MTESAADSGQHELSCIGMQAAMAAPFARSTLSAAYAG